MTGRWRPGRRAATARARRSPTASSTWPRRPPGSALADADLVDPGRARDRLPGAHRRAGGSVAGAPCRRPRVVTDVASTKTAILRRADAAGLRFVGGHPMAGLETAGYAAADGRLFVDRPWVVVARRARRARRRRPGRGPRDGLRGPGRPAGCRRPRPSGGGHQPSAPSRRGLAGREHRRPARGRSRRPRSSWPPAAGATRPGSPAAIRRWARRSWPPTRRRSAARIRDLRAVLDGWLAELERPGGPDEAAVRDRLAAARASLDEPG